jgi:hypothetical protein
MSPTAAEETQKPKLSKKLLGDCGIFFYESVCGDEDLDEWLISIRDQLIRLRRKLPDDVEEEFAEELDIFRTSGQDSAEAFESGWSLMPPDTQSEPAYFRRRVNETDPSVKRIDIEINVCRRIATEARLWRVRNEQESTWVSFLQEHFFRPYYKVHNNPNSHE